jgi:hypothetical protein
VEGKKADIVVFDMASPAMLCAGEEDPLAAILLHASVRDIEMVIIDGEVRKSGGQLRNVMVADAVDKNDGDEMGWDEVTEEVLRSRQRVLRRAERQDFQAGLNASNLIGQLIRINFNRFSGGNRLSRGYVGSEKIV